MPDINITVAHKVAVSDTQSIVCDNSDYTVHWTLDEDWSAYDTKTMRTIYMDGTYTDTVFSGGVVALPVCTVPGVVQIGLFAGDIRTSRVAILRALPSVRSADGAPADPTPDVYDQLMELIKGLGGADPEAIKTAVAEYLAAHPIEETDPTVPAWAKAETKPTYSAAEVGAIAQSDLQTATDAALAQAKASGEFDGATGPQGPAGAPGKDGAGMDITGATVGQIAKISAVDASGVPTAWSPVDIPSGGGEKPVVKIIDTEITEKTIHFEANNLQGVSAIVAIWSGIFNETDTDSGLDFQINDVNIASYGFIKNARKDNKVYGYSVAKLVNGFWVCDIAPGAISTGNIRVGGGFLRVNSLVADVGTANKIVFSASGYMYAPISGRLEVWAR